MKGTSLIEVAPLALAVGLGVQAGQARAQVAVDPAPPVPPAPLQPYEITADARLDALQRQLNEQTQRLQQMREAMLKAMRAQLKPAANRWDDGTYGNRYEDFDEVAEGFRDRDQDGIGEAAHKIPGGSSVDRHPLSEERIADLRQTD